MLISFCTLSLVSGLILTLLPEGSMRSSARLVTGLLMLLLWADGIQSLLTPSSLPDLPRTPLTSTGVTLPVPEEVVP